MTGFQLSKDAQITGGYDSERAGEKSPAPLPAPHWTVRKTERLYSVHIVAQLFKDEKPMGLLYLDSEEDFHTIRQRVEGLV
jgi:hypothetical protein